MPGTSLCPTPESLQQFLMGLSPAAQADELTRHLETCSRCLAIARVLQPADPLIQSLRRARMLTETSPSGVVAQVMESLRRRGNGTPATPPAKRDHSFLSPPRAPGELGWLGPYRVLQQLGQGGMGVVFLAEDPDLQRRVALKVMQPDWAIRPVARQRFLREARAAAALDHPHVITIHHVGEADGIPFLVMPLLQGETLASRLMRQVHLPLQDAMRLAREVALGLDAAHERGLIHRDVKPANIWLETLPVQFGAEMVRDRAKLLDFGLAWAADTESPLTPPEVMVGTPAYMAPELARGQKFDARCDLFSLGCVLYQMLTSQLPFGGLDPRAAMCALLTTDPRPPHELNPGVPARLSALILRLLAKEPDSRPASAQVVVLELQTIGSDLPTRPEGPAATTAQLRPNRETVKASRPPGVSAPPTVAITAPILPVPPPAPAPAPTPTVPETRRPVLPVPARSSGPSPLSMVPRDKVRVKTVEAFRQAFVHSRLLPGNGAEEVYQRWVAEAGKDANSLDRFTSWLVDREYLTRYQAALLIRGHGDHFYLNQYKILDRIGQGRMAGVYKAVHQLGQVVAIKVLPPSKVKDKEAFGRFQRESRLALKLKHPNVVRTFQVGNAGKGRYHYIIMEYLEGETLEELLQRTKRLPPPEAVRLIHQALLGLQHIHDQGMVHRDMKPANLMLVPGEGTGECAAQTTVKLLDIGLGRAFFDPGAAGGPLTNEDASLGTPEYMAPEQARNAHTVDIRADIYSLGCVLFQTLTGQPPFADEKPLRQMIRHATEAPPRLRSLNPDVPDALQQVVDGMLAKDPAQRYPTPERAAQALQAVLTRPERPQTVETDPQMQSYLEWLEAGNAEEEVDLGAPVWAPPPGGGANSMTGLHEALPSAPVPRLEEPPQRLAPPAPESVPTSPRSPLFMLGVGATAGIICVLAAAGVAWLILNYVQQ
jgi:serine/threonine protein kinase